MLEDGYEGDFKMLDQHVKEFYTSCLRGLKYVNETVW